MGFSVTAANAIFFVAALTAAGVTMDVIFHSSKTTTEARATWSRSASSAVATDLTLSVSTCNSNCDNPTVPVVEIDVLNSGTTVVDYRNLTFVIDGRAHPYANFTDADIISPSALSNTALIMPGETMRIRLLNVPVSADYDADDDATDADDLPVIVITGDGVIGGR